MNSDTHHSPEIRRRALSPIITPLALETRHVVETSIAAHHLGRTGQTLRRWACRDDGPIRPLRINGRLAWRVADLKRVLGVA